MQTQSHNPHQFDFKALADAWPAPVVARTKEQLDRFSGGLLNPKDLANRDSLGTGPEGKIKLGRKVAYEKYALAEWMNQRATEGGAE